MKGWLRRIGSALREAVNPNTAGLRFLALALWLCVAGSVWLEPVARERRSLEARNLQVEQEVQEEWRLNAALERQATGLQNDPAMIELQARTLGYGRPGEQEYAVNAKELRDIRSRLSDHDAMPDFQWSSALAASIAPALLLLIAGAIVVLFFANLRVEDHLPVAPEGAGGAGLAEAETQVRVDTAVEERSAPEGQE